MKIKDLFDIRKGKKNDNCLSHPAEGYIRYIQIEDLRTDANLKYCKPNSTTVICNENDIIITWDGANAGTISYGLNGAIGSTLAILRPINNNNFTPYFGHFLKTKSNSLRIQCTGATIPHIAKSTLLNLDIPLPPLDIQKKIAAVLDKADAIRRMRKEAIEKLDKLVQAVFLDMFGDPRTNPKKWKIGTIKDLVSDVKYGSGQKADQEGECPILRMNNITYNGTCDLTDLKYIDLSESDKSKYLVKKGDLLFNRTNSKELVGKTAVYRGKEPMAYAGYLIRVRPNETANNEYISGYLNSKYGKAILFNMCKNIIGMANINAQELQNIQIPKPPVELQNKYAAIIDNILSKKALLIQNSEDINKLFSSLLQRAFKGELTFNDKAFKDLANE